jgi:hypothetical protein
MIRHLLLKRKPESEQIKKWPTLWQFDDDNDSDCDNIMIMVYICGYLPSMLFMC